MRVLLSCLQGMRRHDIPAHAFWRDYFVRGAEEAGWGVLEVPEVDWAEGITDLPPDSLERWKSRTWERTLSFARAEHQSGGIDLFIGYLYPQQIEPGAIAELRRIGIPCVNFFCDNVRELRRVPEPYRGFDLHWVPEFETLPMYAAAGMPHLHAPMPCWVRGDLRRVPERETEPPTFLGSADILRRQLLGGALESGARFMLRGPGWAGDARVPTVRPKGGLLRNQIDLVERHGFNALTAKLADRMFPIAVPSIDSSSIAPPVFGEDYIRVTREAVVTLGVNRVPAARRPLARPLAYSRLRDIEAPMLGACYLTEHCEGVSRLYDVGREIETYRTPVELAEKLGELTADASRRQAMRRGAQERALRDHSVPVTLGRIRERLGLGIPSSMRVPARRNTQ